MDYIIECRTAICGHSFCDICIQESLIRKKECPNCRKEIRACPLTKSEIIDTAVKLMVKAKDSDKSKLTGKESEEEQVRHSERVKQYKEWREKHELPTKVKPGDRIDALDTEHIWCKAIVELVLYSKGRKPLLFIHYEVS